MRLTLRHVAAVTTFILAACSGDDVTPAESPSQSESKLVVTLSASTDTIPQSTTKQLTARVTDNLGMPKNASVNWSSTDPNVASVSGGSITGVTPGVASIIASANGAADTATVIVTLNELTLDVQPSGAAVVAGDTISFTATMRNADGSPVSINSYNWKVSDTSVAQFVGDGSLVMKKEGELSVLAEAMQRQGVSTVRVYKSPVASVTISPSTANINKGGSLTLQATLRDQQGRLVEGPIVWGSTNYSMVTVTQDGVVTGAAVGSAVITATSDNKTGSATINVMSAPTATIALSFPATTLAVGAQMQVSATPRDEAGNTLTGKTIAWQSANPSIATVTSAGVVKGIAAGTVKISAIIDGVIAGQNITVTAATPTSITISPSAPTVSAGQQVQLDARVADQNGAEMSGQAVSWSSLNTAVATVSPSGVLTGVSGGTASIRATSGALSATVTATVGGAAVASVRMTPTSATITEGGQSTLVAQGLDASGSVLAGRTATWSSANPTVATVSNSGVVTAVLAGSTTITATIEGKTATASITVNAAAPAPVASVTVSLANSTLDPGQTTQATATLKDASGNVLTGRTVTWTSLDTAIAKVSASGLVTAVAGGTVAIMAKSGTPSGSASLTVTTPAAAPVARLTIAVPTQALSVGQQVQSVVTLYDANNNVLTGRTITYSSTNAAVITVSASGVVKGMGAGNGTMKVVSGTASNVESFSVTGTSTPTVASIAVTPATTSIAAGGTTQASAVAKDASGATISGVTFAWTTSNANVATVSSTGLVSGVAAGSATISAAASGKTGTMGVTVTAPPPSGATVSTVTVALSPTSALVGGTAQATAVAKDASGAVISGKTATWSVGGSSLASITAGGLVTALGAGTVTVTGTIDGKVGSAVLTITAPAPLPPPTGNVNVALPQVYLNYSYPARTGQTIIVPAGGNLQTALNNAQRGDEIVLTAGATYSGNFTLPTKSGTAANGWITIRSDKSAQLPAMGTRVTSANAGVMAKIETPNTSPALKTVGATSGWWISGIEVTVSSAVTAVQYGLVNLGEGGAPQTTLSSVPSDLVLDRMYIHGQATTNLIRCVALNSARSQVSDSYLGDCHASGYDSQAIWGGNGPGPYKIVNNTLSGAGENVMFGGQDPAIPGLVPSDIEIRRNYIYTPVAWKGKWTRKNLLELKNATRVLIEGNVLDGSWHDAQTGWAVIFKSANQSGGCRWCRTTDVTFRRNLIRNSGAGLNVAPYGDNPATDTTARRILVSEVVAENIGVAPYDGDQRAFQMLPNTASITIEKTVAAGNFTAVLMMDKSPGTSGAVLRDNVWARGQYGVLATGASPGTPSLTVGAPGASWSNMSLVGSSNGSYPTGTSWIASEGSAPLASQIRSTVSSATAGVIIP